MEALAEFFHVVFQAVPIGITLETLKGQPQSVEPASGSLLRSSKQPLRGEQSRTEDAENQRALFDERSMQS